MGVVVPWKRAEWTDLLRLKDYIKFSKSDVHLKYFKDIYKQKKQEYIASSH